MIFVHAICKDRSSAQHFVDALVGAGFPPTDIGALRWSSYDVAELRIEHKTGVGLCGTIGALIGLVLGPIAAANGWVQGPFGGVADGMAIGVAAGALLGTLAGLAAWRDAVQVPPAAFSGGTVLLGVSTIDGRVRQAARALRAAGADVVYLASTPGVRAPHAS